MNKERNILFFAFFICSLFYSCDKYVEQEFDKVDSSNFGILKPQSIVPMGKPEIHKVNFDSVEEVEFSIAKEKPKMRERIMDPHRASYAPVIRTIRIDSSGLEVFVLGKDVSLPKTYEIPKTGYKVQYGDTIYAPVKIKAKQTENQSVKPMIVMPTTVKDIRFVDESSGLPTPSIRCSLQASDNYIWLATGGRGIIRYDGNGFLHYTKNSGLYYNYPSCLLEDKNAHIWIGMRSNLGVMDSGITKFDGVHFFNYDHRQGFSEFSIRALYEDSAGQIWVATQGDGVFVYKKDEKKETITHYTSENGLLANKVFSFLEDTNGSMWIGTEDGLCKFDGEKFTTVSQFKNSAVKSIVQDKKGDIWYSDLSSINKIDKNVIVEYKAGKHTEEISSMVASDHGILWIATWDGLSYFDGENFMMYTDQNGLNSYRVSNVTKDKNDNLWISTLGGGVHKLKENSFNTYPKIPGMGQVFATGFANDTTGGFWLAGMNINGLVKHKDGYFQNYYLKGARSRFVYADRSNNFWTGAYYELPYHLIKYDGDMAYKYSFEDFSKNNVVTGVLEDLEGIIWIATLEGLYKLDGDRLFKFDERNGVPAKIIKMALDKKGNLWLCTRNGLSMFDGQRFATYTENNGLIRSHLSNFMFDHNDNLLISTRQGISLLKVNNENSTLTHSYNYGKTDAIRYQISLTLLEDNDHNIWAGTNTGIDRLSPTDKFGVYTKISFTKDDGYFAGLGTLHGVFLDQTNTIWWGALSGLVNLDINKTNFKHTKPSISLNEIEIKQEFIDFHRLEDSIYVKSIPFGSTIKNAATDVVPFENYPEQMTLSYNLNHLKFKFSGLDWKSPNAIQYQYILEGSDEHWSELTKENFAEYRNISYGDFTFKVKAIGKTGLVSETFSYDFSISPPWWHTWWARTVYLLLGILSVYLIVKLRANAIRKEFAEKERLWAITDKQNKRFLDFSFITSHNIRIAAANLSGIHNLIKNDLDPELSQMLSTTDYKLGNSIEHMNQLLHTDNFTKEPKKESYAFITAINKAIDKNKNLINKQKALFKLDVPEDLEIFTLYKYLDNILHQLVKNALIFGTTDANKIIEIFTKNENDVTVLVVKDYGLGIDMDIYQNDIFSLGSRFHPEYSEGEGLGLYISKNQINTLGWDIQVESQVGLGSTFKVICYG